MHFLSPSDCRAVAGGANDAPREGTHVVVAFPEPMPGMPYRLPFFPPLDVD